MQQDCVFCQIIAGQIPAHKVYEDDQFLAFLDIRPLTKGNTLVIPKEHYRWVIDVPQFGSLWEVAKKVGLAQQKTLGAEWVSFLTLGMEVAHAHIRVIPRYPDDGHKTLVEIEKYLTLPEVEMNLIAKNLNDEIGGVVSNGNGR